MYIYQQMYTNATCMYLKLDRSTAAFIWAVTVKLSMLTEQYNVPNTFLFSVLPLQSGNVQKRPLQSWGNWWVSYIIQLIIFLYYVFLILELSEEERATLLSSVGRGMEEQKEIAPQGNSKYCTRTLKIYSVFDNNVK